MPRRDHLCIFAGSSNPQLAAGIGRALKMPLSPRFLQRFPDGELRLELQESVAEKNVVIIQSTCPPVEEHLMELLAFADAARRAGAHHIMAVLPYFGYARSEMRHGIDEPILASLVARMMECSGIDRILTMDLHTPQIEGFFSIPFQNISAVALLSQEIQTTLPAQSVIVSADASRLKMASCYAKILGASVAVLQKERNKNGVAQATQLMGEVANRPCLVIDDMISTGATMAEALKVLAASGATEFYIVATHAVLTPGALHHLSHPGIREIYLTNTIPQRIAGRTHFHFPSVASLFAEAIAKELDIGTLGACDPMDWNPDLKTKIA